MNLGLTDVGDYLRISGATTVTVNVLQQSSVAWAADSEIIMEQRGAGQLQISGGTNVTINKRTTTQKTKGQYSVVALKRVSENVWTLFGDLEA
jgi:hypothetical protein